MTRQELITNIIGIAQETVRSRNCYFSQEAESQLREMVANGVTYTMSDLDINNPMQVARAERNIRELCVKLCERARNENKLIVENRIFSSARLSLCPIWPFC